MFNPQAVQQRVDAYRGNPQPLVQKYSVSQELVDLLALQQINKEKQEAARQMQLQMAQAQGQQPPTVAQQLEGETRQLAQREVAQRQRDFVHPVHGPGGMNAVNGRCELHRGTPGRLGLRVVEDDCRQRRQRRPGGFREAPQAFAPDDQTGVHIAALDLARGEHPTFEVVPGDRVILSARTIPGNEPEVHAVIGSLIRRGVEVVTRATERGIHVSGHAHRPDQRRMIELVRRAASSRSTGRFTTSPGTQP